LNPATSGVVVDTLISDHFPVFIICDDSDCQKLDLRKFRGRHIDPAMIAGFNQALMQAFDGFLEIESPDAAVERFCLEIETRIDHYFPVKVINRKTKPIKPWITADIVHAINRKNALYRAFVITKSESSWSAFKVQRNLVIKEIRKAKKHYYQDLITKNEGNSKRTWQILNEIIGRGDSKPSTVQQIRLDDDLKTDPLDVASGLNDFFTTIGEKLDQSIPISQIDPTSYIERDFIDTCFLHPVTPVTIQNVLREMKGKGGTDQPISAKIIKLLAESVATPLSHIVNLCFANGYFPGQLKFSTVTPVHKTGNKDTPGNYRPISVLSPISKIIERCISQRILSYISMHDILGSNQYGFRTKHSTEHALINFVDYVTDEKEKGNFVLGIYCDIKKAFDSVNFAILYKKLEKYGIRGRALDLIKSYLTNRKQRVKIMKPTGEIILSDVSDVTCGVPQGSVLGPLLFLIYVNDLQNVSPLFRTITFADDTNLFAVGPNLDTLCTSVNVELGLLKNWFDCNRLCLNISKTCFQLYTSKMNYMEPCLLINNVEIKREPSVKFLGVIVDEQLSFKAHIEYVAKKVALGIGFMYRSRDILNKKQLKLLYNTIVLPHLSYSSLVWGINFPTHLKRLLLLQKRAARVILGLGYTESVLHRFPELGLNPLCELTNLRCMIMIYKIKRGLAPPQLAHLLEWRIVNPEEYAIRNRGPLMVPFAYTRARQNTFRVFGAKLFNRLSGVSELTIQTSISIFKKEVRRLLGNNFQ